MCVSDAGSGLRPGAPNHRPAHSFAPARRSTRRKFLRQGIVGLSVANSLCAQYYGTGWRLAEFHDGRHGSNLESRGGWSFWAHDCLPGRTRFWAAIDDQPANPWN